METMGDFLNVLSKDDATEVYLNVMRMETDPSEWRQFIEASFCKEEVLRLASSLRDIIRYHISRGSTDDFCLMLQRDGHEILKRFYLLVYDKEFDISLNDVDGQLTFCEAMEAQDIIEIQDGKVTLTEKGTQLLRDSGKNV